MIKLALFLIEKNIQYLPLLNVQIADNREDLALEMNEIFMKEKAILTEKKLSPSIHLTKHIKYLKKNIGGLINTMV